MRPRGKVTLTFALQFVRTRSASQMETRQAQGVESHSSDADRAADEIRFAGLRDDGWTVVELESDHVFTPEGRQEKLGELAHHLGLDPAALDLAAAEPQFFAPPQFERPRRRRAR
ncbi:hypothetical protein [Terracoccus luteus]|uniref:Uncharacterized protein n=1 Tax=Terracoccus luteus TaxID=53356 RepID=A0A839PXW7_9MICO|nr:hypothetical protein [Terracoccus luteus]MBB2985632.1 hypothetical protein [Terracoccus luteus]MCP2171284.1 hypothetical protein [Terracoccus luteus]